jgi:environmental stress-induced protein Ves
MRISPPAAIESVPAVPWKNGAGVTRTLAVEPDGAGYDDFLWRVSLAEVHDSSTFSAFPGLDRTIMLWRGDGVVLKSPAWPQQFLTAPPEPFRFRGEDEVSCNVIGGHATDLNMMVRRGMAFAELRCMRTETSFSGPLDDLVVLCATGKARVRLADGIVYTLERDRYLRITQLDSGVTILPATSRTRFAYAAVRRVSERKTQKTM